MVYTSFLTIIIIFTNIIFLVICSLTITIITTWRLLQAFRYMLQNNTRNVNGLREKSISILKLLTLHLIIITWHQTFLLNSLTECASSFV